MEILTQTANMSTWIEASDGLEITAYVRNYAPTLTVSGMALSVGNWRGELGNTGLVLVSWAHERGTRPRQSVVRSLEKSLDEHAQVWSELAQY